MSFQGSFDTQSQPLALSKTRDLRCSRIPPSQILRLPNKTHSHNRAELVYLHMAGSTSDEDHHLDTVEGAVLLV